MNSITSKATRLLRYWDALLFTFPNLLYARDTQLQRDLIIEKTVTKLSWLGLAVLEKAIFQAHNDDHSNAWRYMPLS